MDLSEACDNSVTMWGLGMISRPDAKQGLHTGCPGSIQLASHVRDEEDIRGRNSKRCCNSRVACRLILRPGHRVEISLEVLRELACIRSGEKQALRQNASRGENTDINTTSAPTFERRRYIGEDFAMELAGCVTFKPDLAWNTLRRG